MNNFGEVVRHYESIAPVVSIHNSKKNDVRPVHRRSDKGLRIEKVSDDCYVYTESQVFYRTHKLKTSKEVTRRKYLNGLYTTASVIWTNYNNKEVLYFVSPDYLVLYKELEKIHLSSGNYSKHSWLSNEFTSLTFKVGKPSHGVRPVESRFSTNYLHNGDLTHTYTGDEENEEPHNYLSGHLAYTRNANGLFVFNRYLSGSDANKVIRIRVDKKLKAEYKPHIESLYNYFYAYEPSMYEVTEDDRYCLSDYINPSVRESFKRLTEKKEKDELLDIFAKALGDPRISGYGIIYEASLDMVAGRKSKEIRSVLAGDNEEAKIGLLKFILVTIDYMVQKNKVVYMMQHDVKNSDVIWETFVKKTKSSLNRCLNNMCDFNSVQLVDSDTLI
jgi:hypothetical protein